MLRISIKSAKLADLVRILADVRCVKTDRAEYIPATFLREENGENGEQEQNTIAGACVYHFAGMKIPNDGRRK